MKKLFIFAILIAVLSSCGSMGSMGSMAKFTKTSTYTGIDVVRPITALMADLEVSSEKISYLFIPSQTVKTGGFENVLNCAVQEALEKNGNADVLVALEKQIKYNKKGEIESIVITGYPAKYVNFRSPGDDYLLEMSKAQPAATSGGKSFLEKLKF